MPSGFVLGVSCYFHDSAAAIVFNGSLIAAAEEERFSRKKHDNGLPVHAIKFCLEAAGIDAKQLDAVVFYEDTAKKLSRVGSQIFKNLPETLKIIPKIVKSWHAEKLWPDKALHDLLGLPASKFFYVDHHTAHAAAGFFNSGFDSAAIITLDGVGEWATSTFGSWADRHGLSIDREIRFPHSLGLLYSCFAEYLGFEVNEGEFKVMGMSSYGTPRYVDKIEKLFSHRSKYDFSLNEKFFSYQYSSRSNITAEFYALMGEGRNREEPFFLPEFADEFDDVGSKHLTDATVIARSRRFADIAASIQVVVEDQILSMTQQHRLTTGCENLVLGGGVAYNCVANGRVIRESGYKRVFIFPAAGDSGSAVGAAQAVSGNKVPAELSNAYLGREYSDEAIISAIDKAGFSFTECASEDELAATVAEAIASGVVVGWFQGRFEFGPRALGNRSILADPRRKATKRLVNESVKYREVFRPFAPIVKKDAATKYFDLTDQEANQAPYRFMLSVCRVREKYRDSLGATTHANGTSRVQILDSASNPLLFSLLERFESHSGFPVLLNTSFNRRGEPLVASPDDALRTFAWSGLGLLAIGKFIIRK
jgi:carbamoyltransferase